MARIAAVLASTAFAVGLLPPFAGWAQVDCNQGLEPIDHSAESPMSAHDFIYDVATKETGYAKAFGRLGYRVEIVVQTLKDDSVDGEFRQVTTLAVDDKGVRRPAATEGPTNTLTRLTLTPRDVDGFLDGLPFALKPDNLADRDVVYSGRQRVGGHNAAVFDLLPRSQQAEARGFSGRTWVWGGEAVILKTCGRNSAFPIAALRYEIVREQVAGDNWLPVLLRADENTVSNGRTVHVRVTVKYSEYKAR